MSDWQSNYLDDIPADSALLRYSEYYDEYFDEELEEECPACHGTGLDRDEVYDCDVCFGDGVITILPKGLTGTDGSATLDGNDANEEGL